MSSKGRILLAVTNWDPSIWETELKRHGPEREVVLAPSGETDPTIDYAVVWKQEPGLLARLPNLKAVFSLGAGVDHIFASGESLPEVPIVRVVSPDLTMRMSEYVVWQVLDHHRQGPQYRAQQAERVWRERDQPAAHEVTVGIMGLGELGRDAAARLKALGFNVTGWSRRKKQVDGVECYAGDAELADFLTSAEIFVVLLPLTSETHGILNRDLFAKMTRRDRFDAPVLINAGRGKLQVTADILAALDEGLLSAATLDVFETEPLDRDSPAWSHPKVTLTPHAAASSTARAIAGPIIRQMEAFERGEPLENLVDKSAGY